MVQGRRGLIKSIRDSVVVISGLDSVKVNEMIDMYPNNMTRIILGTLAKTGKKGVVLNLEVGIVKALAFCPDYHLHVGYCAFRTRKLIGFGIDIKTLLGRVINPLSNFIDNVPVIDIAKEKADNFTSKIKTNVSYLAVEIKAAGIMERRKVIEPVVTGIKMIDMLVPIGRGQRELIIGDKKTGKTTIAIDTILNQKGTGVVCIYVAIGKRLSEIARVIRTLKLDNAMQHTIMVISSASDPASLQYIAPYSGCAIAEQFAKIGVPAVVIYDDLSRHADVYRQISLLLRRPVGREAYPGDVFYLHSRLLERAGRIQQGFGITSSVTALPIVETLQGDVSAYVPTNIISITDGQIFLDGVKHQEGLRPAVDPGISVSRIGSAAQPRFMKNLAGSLKLQLAQFREVEEFAKFGSDLDAVTKKTLADGLRLTEMLKQAKNKPVSIYKQVVLLYAGALGFLDNIDVSFIEKYELNLYDFLENHDIFMPYRYVVDTSKIVWLSGVESNDFATSLISVVFNVYLKNELNDDISVDSFGDNYTDGSFKKLSTILSENFSKVLSAHYNSFKGVFKNDKIEISSRFQAFLLGTFRLSLMRQAL